MATFWNGIVNTTNGSDEIVVTSGDDINLISERSLLQVEGGQVVEVVRAYGTTIELALPWDGSTASGRDAIAVPTAGNLAEASERLRDLGDQATTILNTAITEEVNDLTTNVTWDTVPDAYIGESSVKQYTTTSRYDVTLGRLLKSGDYGIGLGLPPVTGGDLNSISSNGFHFVAASSNAPDPAKAYIMLHASGSSSGGTNNRSAQVVFNYGSLDTDQAYIRTYNGSAWQSWSMVYTTANLNPVTLNTTQTITGAKTFSSPVKLPNYTVSGLPAGSVRDIAYCSDGDAGSPCLAVHDGTSWKRVPLGATVSAT